MANDTVPEPRPPRPVWPITCAALAAVSVLVAVFCFVAGSILGGVVWTVLAALFALYFLPATLHEYWLRCAKAEAGEPR